MDRSISRELFDKVRHERDIALKALRKIADCNEQSCEKYVAKVDGMAIDALVEIEAGGDGMPRKTKSVFYAVNGYVQS